MCGYNSERRLISLGFTGEKVKEGQHICYIYNNDNERRYIINKYLESGILEREKVLYLVDSMTPDEMLSSLEDLDIDIRDRRAHLNVAEAGPTYCPNGVFRSGGDA